MKYCGKCGCPYTGGKFCSNCGAPMGVQTKDKPSSETSVPPPPHRSGIVKVLALVGILAIGGILTATFLGTNAAKKPPVPETQAVQQEEGIQLQTYPAGTETEHLPEESLPNATATEDPTVAATAPETAIMKNTLDMSKLPVKKETLRSITFLNSFEDAPVIRHDLTLKGNGSVVCWTQPAEQKGNHYDEDDQLYDLYIAAEGDIYAPEDSYALFRSCKNLVAIHFNDIFHTDNVVNMMGMFARCPKLKEIDLAGLDTSNVTNMKDLFYESFDYGDRVSLDLSKWDTSKVTNMSSMFYGCQAQSINLRNLDASSVTDMSRMFYHCRADSINFRGIDTSNVTDMSEMFLGASALISLDLSDLDTANVTDMSKMFRECQFLSSLNLKGFDTSAVTDMSEMFFACESLVSLDLSSFDTSNVVNMSNMFANCMCLKKLNLGSFNTASVTDMNSMFLVCSSLTKLDLHSFVTSNVVNMSNMFTACFDLKSLNLSGWDTSAVTDMSSMFNFCDSLKTLDLSGFDMRNVTNHENMLPEHLSCAAVGLNLFL